MKITRGGRSGEAGRDGGARVGDGILQGRGQEIEERVRETPHPFPGENMGS